MGPTRENRHEILLKVGGVEIPVLYDTGAAVTCLSRATFEKHFRHYQRHNHSSVGVKGAGDNNLDLYGIYTIPVQWKNKKEVQGQFMVCNELDIDLIGIDLINELGISYDAKAQQVFSISDEPNVLKVTGETTLKELQTSVVKVRYTGPLTPFATQVVTIASPNHRHLMGGPAIVEFNKNKVCLVAITNTAPYPITLRQNEFIGALDQWTEVGEPVPLDQKVIDQFIHKLETKTQRFMTDQEIADKANLNVPDQYKAQYLALLQKYRKVISVSKTDLGRCNKYKHRLHLKDNDPVYQKQFPLKPDHQMFVEQSLQEWLRLGVVRRTKSSYNSPIFCVPKKSGQGLRIVQDFRGLNAKTHTDKYSMKEVNECISDIGRANSTIFTTIDLTSGFWQMPIDESDSHTTAFTVQGIGQFEWVTSPMGLLGCPASFQRLMEKVLDKIKNIIVYIDDVIIHTGSHEHHLEVLDNVLERLQHHNLKINLAKCFFGNSEVAYLGFVLTPEGIRPGKEKLSILREMPPPTNQRQVRAFIGLCNFFRNHIKNFALIAQPLHRLTRKDVYKEGPIDPEALKAFHTIKNALISEPVVAFPRADRKFALISEAHPASGTNEGCLSATLCQIDDQGSFHVLSYASRQLQTHELNYPPFLLEMANAVFGMETYDEYLRGRPFTLFMDERPQPELSHLHKKTLARFTALSLEYNFVIQNKTGSGMPLFLRAASPAQVNALSPTNPQVLRLQSEDPDLQLLYNFRITQAWPGDLQPDHRLRLETLNKNLLIDNDNVVWVQCKPESPEAPPKTALYLPMKFRDPVICQFRQRNPDLSVSQQVAKLQENYCWIGMKQDLQQHPEACANCAQLKLHKQTNSVPNAVVHLDIHGPFPSYADKKFIAVFTDEATKITTFAAMTNKSAEDISAACFVEWICKMSVPQVIDTNLSESQADDLKDELDLVLNQEIPNNPFIDANRGSCFNQKAADSINKMVHTAELSWEDFLPALNFAHNTSYHSSITSTPFETLYGYKPRIPLSNLEAVTSPHSFSTERMKIFQKAIEFANSDVARMAADSLPEIETFRLQQLVMLSEKSFGETKWTGPVKIVQIMSHKIRVQFSDGKVRWIKNLQRLRPLEDFSKQGEGYVLKSESANSVQKVQSDPTTVINDQRPVSQCSPSEQIHRSLIRSTRTKARQFFQDQQAEDQLINAIQTRQNQLIRGDQNQAPLINLIDAGLRPYILDLSHRLCINQDLDFDPFTPQERHFWESLDPQERNTLLTGNPLALPEYRTQLCIFHKTPSQAPAAPAPLPPAVPGPSGGSRPLQPVPPPLPPSNQNEAESTSTPGPSLDSSLSSRIERTPGQRIQKFSRKFGSELSSNIRSSMKKLSPGRMLSKSRSNLANAPTAQFYAGADWAHE